VNELAGAVEPVTREIRGEEQPAAVGALAPSVHARRTASVKEATQASEDGERLLLESEVIRRPERV